jgi:hypothetical protein
MGAYHMMVAALVVPGPAREEAIRCVIADPEVLNAEPKLPVAIYIQFKDTFPHNADAAVSSEL